MKWVRRVTCENSYFITYLKIIFYNTLIINVFETQLLSLGNLGKKGNLFLINYFFNK